MKEHTLTKGSVGRGILLFVLPIIVGSLIQQLYVTIDAVVVGQIYRKTWTGSHRFRAYAV